MAEKNYFQELYDINLNEKKKNKNGLNYISWAVAWAEVKKHYPDATYSVSEEMFTSRETVGDKEITKTFGRPWFDDGRTGWVKVGVTINGICHEEMLPILDFKNKPVPADSITSYDANKAIQRAITKACARHGIGTYVYEGEDIPEETKELERLRDEIKKIAAKKNVLSDAAKEEVAKISDEYLKEYGNTLSECDDVDKLSAFKRDLMKIRK